MRIICIGGAGFGGSHFVDKLISEKHEVIVYDDLSTGKKEFINSKATFIKGDILDRNTLESVIDEYNIDMIHNFAVKPLLQSLQSPIEGLRVNTEGVINCCEIALKYDARYIHISSSEVFGTAVEIPQNEKHPRHPTTPYGASKCAGDYYVQSYALCMKLKSTVVRPFNFYGPRMRMDTYCNVIYAFVKRLLEGESPIIHGNGEQTRDLTFVSDIVDGIYLASIDEKLIGHSINIGSGKQTTILEVAKLCNKYFKNKHIIFENERFSNDVMVHQCDNSRMLKRYGWEPKIDFEEGLRITIQWIIGQYNESKEE